ncbi:MAG: OB-fold domain-containing protein [Hadesarchaea archaeon]|nr:OB-fold domain-containing protein [Hadesarchaea archaeon]MDH5685030.1 OB-fold domain-containing protein [Hadesarchaea archaeon]
MCPNCHSRDFEEYEFSHEGEVFSFMQDSVPAPLMGMHVYGRDRRIIASVKLKEGVCIMPTELVDCKLEEVKEGMKVRLVVRKLRRANNGNWLYGYMWTPIKE